jgi:hypothetical protein
VGAARPASSATAGGWSYGEDGFVELRMKDRSAALTVLLESGASSAAAGRGVAPASPCAR